MKNSYPKRGEIYWVNWSPARGSEQAGRRPALIVQNDIGNEYSRTTIVVTITTTTKNYEFFVPLEPGEGGTRKNSAVNTAHLALEQRGVQRGGRGIRGSSASRKAKCFHIAPARIA